MILSLHAYFEDIHEENCFDMMVGLKTWKLYLDCLGIYANSHPGLEAQFALLDLASASSELKVEALFKLLKKSWPKDFNTLMTV